MRSGNDKQKQNPKLWQDIQDQKLKFVEDSVNQY